MPGTYTETLHLDNFTSALRLNFDPASPLTEDSHGLLIEGDSRHVAGVTYESGALQAAWASRVWNSPTAPTQIVSYDPPLGTCFGEISIVNVPTPGVASNTVDVTIISAPNRDPQDWALLKGTIVQPDFVTLNVVIGDKIAVCDSTNVLSTRTVTSVLGNRIGFDGAPALFDNNGSAITFLPNVTVLNMTAATDTCVVADTSLTFKGIHFQVSATSFNVRNNFLVAGAAAVQTANCVFSDFGYVTEMNVYVTDGATWVCGDRSNGRQILDPAVTGYAIPYTWNNMVGVLGGGSTGNLSNTVIGGGNRVDRFIFAGSITVDKGATIQSGSLWIVNANGLASNFAIGCSLVSSGVCSVDCLQTTGGGFSLEIIEGSTLNINLIAAYLKAGAGSFIIECLQGSSYLSILSWHKMTGAGVPGTFPNGFSIGTSSVVQFFLGGTFITATGDGLIMKNLFIAVNVQNYGSFSMPAVGTVNSFDSLDSGGGALQAINNSSITFGRNAIVNITNSTNILAVGSNGASRISFGRSSQLIIPSVTFNPACFILEGASVVTFDRISTITTTGSTGPFSLSYGHSFLNLDNTNLTQQGVVVFTGNGAIEQAVETIALDGAAPRNITLNPALALVGQLCFSARVFKVYARGTPQAHTLTLTSGNFKGVGLAASTVATFNGGGAANNGQGLTFEVMSATEVQVIAFTGVTFS